MSYNVNRDLITITTHPTTANLGALFDIGGARLDGSKNGLIMITEAQYRDEPWFEIRSAFTTPGGRMIYPVPTHEDPKPRSRAYGIARKILGYKDPKKGNLAYKIARKMFEDKKLPGGLVLKFTNYMKPGGLGTSGAGAVATVEAINKIYNLGLTDVEKIAYARLGEPNEHLDNVVPGVIGGIVVSSKYVQIPKPSNIIPSLIVPLELEKDGGTATARKLLEDLVARNGDLVRVSDLSAQMVFGLERDDFRLVRDSIIEYTRWEKSVTALRNAKGVFGIDINVLNQELHQMFGNGAVATPSGAGPAILVLSQDEAVEFRILRHFEERFKERFKTDARVYETPFLY